MQQKRYVGLNDGRNVCVVSHTYLIVSPLVAFHHQLVSSGDEHQAIGVVELLRDVLKCT